MDIYISTPSELCVCDGCWKYVSGKEKGNIKFAYRRMLRFVEVCNRKR